MQFSIFSDRIGLTYLSGTGKKQRFLRVGEMHIYLIVNLSIKHILHNLRNVFYLSFCNFSKYFRYCILEKDMTEFIAHENQ